MYTARTWPPNGRLYGRAHDSSVRVPCRRPVHFRLQDTIMCTAVTRPMYTDRVQVYTAPARLYTSVYKYRVHGRVRVPRTLADNRIRCCVRAVYTVVYGRVVYGPRPVYTASILHTVVFTCTRRPPTAMDTARIRSRVHDRVDGCILGRVHGRVHGPCPCTRRCNGRIHGRVVYT